MKQKISRRSFVKTGGTLALGAGAMVGTSCDSEKKPADTTAGDVYEISGENAIDESRAINKQVVTSMLAAGLKEISSNKESPWSDFVKPTDRIGLKINCLGRPVLYTHHELVDAVIDSLKAYGVKEENIIVWDRYEDHMTACKYTMNYSGPGVAVKATESATNGFLFDDEMKYSSESDNPDKRKEGATDCRVSSIFTAQCDKIINLAILKDHRSAGVTLALKNLAYGLSDNNARFHGREHIGEFIADFCALPMVKEKAVLHIIDAIEGCYDEGPFPKSPSVLFSPKKLLFSRDPVAIDAVGMRIIEEQRKVMQMPALHEQGRPADHITLASQKGLGKSDLAEIKVKQMSV